MLLIALVSLTMLTRGNSEAQAMGFNPTQTVLKTRCPVLKQYSADVVKKLGKELRGAPPDATWPGMIVDYRTLRLMCQAIEAS